MNGVVGLRFRPTEEEIITYYLELKMSGQQFPFPAVKEVDICNYNPWELPEQSIMRDDQVWYFFSAPSKKYANSDRADRATREGTGSWKITAKDREVKNKSTGEVIGIRKTLVFYKGRNPGAIRTGWEMHEYHSNNAASYQKEFVFCRLKFKFHDKSAALPDEAIHFWPLKDWYVAAQSIGSPVNDAEDDQQSSRSASSLRN
ncbi:protein NTM1-like 9 isoform X1 [Mangifera indica]|uniref:protein NTM1-like 9 isoform X1 n=1 Tax=Mangifera indica TaxID=29780 RepID=UPI001CFC2546|nr:protein NTM1-like 9 isoform X1 [Mangifera indica]